MTDENTPATLEKTMHGSTAPRTQSAPMTALHPFQTEGRYREAPIVAQIQFLQNCPSVEFWRRARQTRPDAPEYVHPETLVYLLRDRLRNGKQDAAWEIAELLIERSHSYIQKRVARWKRLSLLHSEDCIRDIQTHMLQDLIDASPGCEFWEVRFWLCLNRCLLNIVQKYNTAAEREFLPEERVDGDGNKKGFFEDIEDTRTLTPEMQTLIREAMALFTEQERKAFVLFRFEDWSQDEIAKELGVTDRTVRNLLARAEKRLEAWRTENLQ